MIEGRRVVVYHVLTEDLGLDRMNRVSHFQRAEFGNGRMNQLGNKLSVWKQSRASHSLTSTYCSLFLVTTVRLMTTPDPYLFAPREIFVSSR